MAITNAVAVCATAQGTACIDTNVATWDPTVSPLGWQSVSCNTSQGDCSAKDASACKDIHLTVEQTGIDACEKRGLDAASGGECTHACTSGCGEPNYVQSGLAYADYCEPVLVVP